ncbi:MAG: DNA polymerase III subunit delta [Syntrophomonadaceae bacterium]|nr:DNA polymerase III subunit delta [Syntrophomonadaceae bacterium]
MSNVYLLYGTDNYIVNKTINDKISELELIHDHPEIVYVDDDETTISQLQDMLTYNSLFAFFRIVVIKNPFWLKKTGRKSGKINEVLEVFKSYFAQNNLAQALIVSTEELNQTSPIVKLFKQNNAEIMECQSLNKIELMKWIKDRLNDKGIKASDEVVGLLADSGQDMYYLENLLEKFALAKVANLTKEHLQNELETIYEVKIFKLTDALLARNLKSALQVLHQLIEQGQTAPYFIAMINNQFISFAKVKAAADKGYNKNQIEQVTGLKSFVVRNMLNHVGKFSWPEIWQLFELLLETDIKIKTTSQDNYILMESLVIKICNK